MDSSGNVGLNASPSTAGFQANFFRFTVPNVVTLSAATPAASRNVILTDCGYANCNLAPNLQNTNGVYAAKRGISGCTTAASAGGVCSSAVTVTWPSAFADTNYSAGCWPSGAPTNLPSAPYVASKTASSISINYFAITAAAAKWASIDCVAIHD